MMHRSSASKASDMNPLYRAIFVLLAWCLLAPTAHADLPLTERCTLRFASKEQGIRAITADDPFTRSLSRFDLQARMQTDRAVTLDDWRRFVAGEVREWDDTSRERLAAAVASLRDRFVHVKAPLPEEIFLVATTGREESEAAYCRGNHIVLPANALRRDRRGLESLLIHEIFHVMSNQHPQLRPKLYAIVGFEVIEPIAIHPALADRRITNPDAPEIDCLVDISDGENRLRTAPVLFSTSTYDLRKERSMFAYLNFRLMAVERDGDSWKAADRDGQPLLIDPKGAKSFHEQIGRNTQYIVHPEEILADNFVHLVLKLDDLPTPRIVERMREVLEEAH
jgi:hypothetical protein